MNWLDKALIVVAIVLLIGVCIISLEGLVEIELTIRDIAYLYNVEVQDVRHELRRHYGDVRGILRCVKERGRDKDHDSLGWEFDYCEEAVK